MFCKEIRYRKKFPEFLTLFRVHSSISVEGSSADLHPIRLDYLLVRILIGPVLGGQVLSLSIVWRDISYSCVWGMAIKIHGSAFVKSLIIGATLVCFIAGCGEIGQNVSSRISGKKVKTVQLKAGEATITDDTSGGVSHVRIKANNGLVINADWKRNPSSEFGYDIYEPSVSMDYNRLAVMMMARGVIAAYLRGEYD